jgi:hypothetical protein
MTYLKGLAAKLYIPTIDWSATRAFVKITGLQHSQRGTILEISYWRTEKSYDDGAQALHIEQLNVDADAYAPLIASVYEVLYQGLMGANKYDTATIVQAEEVVVAPEPLPEAEEVVSPIAVTLDSPPIEILPDTLPSVPTPMI